LTQVLFDLTRRDFFKPEGKKMENLGIFRGNFPNPSKRWLTQPEQQKLTTRDLGQKIFTRTHHYYEMVILICPNSKLLRFFIKVKGLEAERV